ncbi:MAG: hypothetical protein LBC02_01055 [Planctomycetaceae bacterium]|jgi:hypothetical protein|nr:hypothetical protein [Planctomycetaceae bacterium]
MKNVIIYPVKIDHETEKAVSVFGYIWLPKSQIVTGHGCVLALAAWLFHKYKPSFMRSDCKTMEELEEWIQYEKEIRQKMKQDPSLCRCSRCGGLFRTDDGSRPEMCLNCDIDYSISLGHTAKFGNMSVTEKSDALARGIIHKP